LLESGAVVVLHVQLGALTGKKLAAEWRVPRVSPNPNGWTSPKKLNALDYIKLTHTLTSMQICYYLFIINLAQMKKIIVKERRK
jgi:hypothetical protein